jgi:nitrogen fixation/metabolism regulation signal transduction histidine kinase
LGLAIVREIAAGHGARVDLLDPPRGTGLLVRVRFPIVAV